MSPPPGWVRAGSGETTTGATSPKDLAERSNDATNGEICLTPLGSNTKTVRRRPAARRAPTKPTPITAPGPRSHGEGAPAFVMA